jgi:hypothetical protein
MTSNGSPRSFTYRHNQTAIAISGAPISAGTSSFRICVGATPNSHSPSDLGDLGRTGRGVTRPPRQGDRAPAGVGLAGSDDPARRGSCWIVPVPGGLELILPRRPWLGPGWARSEDYSGDPWNSRVLPYPALGTTAALCPGRADVEDRSRRPSPCPTRQLTSVTVERVITTTHTRNFCPQNSVHAGTRLVSSDGGRKFSSSGPRG